MFPVQAFCRVVLIVLWVVFAVLLARQAARGDDVSFGALAQRPAPHVSRQAAGDCSFATLRARQPDAPRAAASQSPLPAVTWSRLAQRPSPHTAATPPAPAPVTGPPPIYQYTSPQSGRCQWTPHGWRCR